MRVTGDASAGVKHICANAGKRGAGTRSAGGHHDALLELGRLDDRRAAGSGRRRRLDDSGGDAEKHQRLRTFGVSQGHGGAQSARFYAASSFRHGPREHGSQTTRGAAPRL